MWIRVDSRHGLSIDAAADPPNLQLIVRYPTSVLEVLDTDIRYDVLYQVDYEWEVGGGRWEMDYPISPWPMTYGSILPADKNVY